MFLLKFKKKKKTKYNLVRKKKYEIYSVREIDRGFWVGIERFMRGNIKCVSRDELPTET